MELILEVRAIAVVSASAQYVSQQPHIVQTVMAAENTPMLAATIPAFELFVNSWEAMKADPVLSALNITHLIDAGLAIAEKYYNKFNDTDAYIIAMCLLLLASYSHQLITLPSYQPVDSLGVDTQTLVTI